MCEGRLEAKRSSPTSLGNMLLLLFSLLLLLEDAGAFRYFPQPVASAGLHKLATLRANTREGEQKEVVAGAPSALPQPPRASVKKDTRPTKPFKKPVSPKAPPPRGQHSNVMKALMMGNSKMDKKEFVRELYRVIPTLSGSDLASVLLSIRDLRLSSRSREMVTISDLLVERLHFLQDVINGRDLSSSLEGLARLGIRLPRDVLKHRGKSFFDALPRTLPAMGDSQVSSTLWAMGKMNIKWDALPIRTRQAIGAAIVRTAPAMAPLGVANTIHGLSNLRAQWGTLPQYIVLALQQALQQTLGKMNEQESSNCMSGMGRLGANWNSLNPQIRDALGKSFLRNIKTLTSQGLAMSVHGLGRMGARMSSLPAALRESILQAIVEISPSLNALEVANILYGLGRMGADFDAGKVCISKAARLGLMEALMREAWQMNEQGISNSLWGLMQMNAHWRMFSVPQKQALLMTLSREARRMDEQQVGNTLYSLGIMGMDWKDEGAKSARLALMTALESVAPSLTAGGVVMTLMGLSKLQVSWASLPAGLSLNLAESTENVLRTASERTLAASIHALSALGMRWADMGPGLQTVLQESIGRSYWDLKAAVVRDIGVTGVTGTPHTPHTLGDSEDKISSTILSAMPSKSAAKLLLSFHNSAPHAKPAKITHPFAGLPFIPRNLTIFDVDSGDGVQYPPTLASNTATREIEAYDSSLSRKQLRKIDMGKGGGGKKKQDVPVELETRVHYTYSLGQLKVPWEELGVSAQIALCGSLVVALPLMNEQGVVNSIHGLSAMGAKWAGLSKPLRVAFNDALTHVSVQMGEQGVSMTILALAKLEVCWVDDLSEALQNALRRAIIRQADIGEHALSNVLYGLGKLEREWEELHPEVRQALLAGIVMCHLRDRCTAQGVSNSLYGLAHMHADWAALSTSVRLALLKEVSKSLPAASESQLSSMLSSLSKMGVQWEQIPPDLHRDLFTRISSHCQQMSEQHISNILFALGSMGISWHQLPSPLTRALTHGLLRVNAGRGKARAATTIGLSTTIESITYVSGSKAKRAKYLQLPAPKAVESEYDSEEFEFRGTHKEKQGSEVKKLNAQGLSMSITGLSRLGASWAMLPSSLSGMLESSLLALLPQMNSVQVANTLAGLGKMKWRWDNLSDELKRQIVTSLSVTVLKSSNFLDISLATNALGQLGVTWNSLSCKSTPFTKAFYRATHSVFLSGSAEEVAGTIFGMGMMELSWEKVPVRSRGEMVDAVLRLFSEPTKPPLAAEPFMDQRHSSLPAPTKKQKHTTRSQAVANIMYGLCLMLFDVKSPQIMHELIPVHIALLDTVSSIGMLDFDDPLKEQILIYMHLLQTVLPSDDQLLLNSHCPTDMMITSAASRPSKLQESVVTSLRSALSQRDNTLKVADEYSPFDGAFPVDATIFEGGLPVAFVEVDGPHHFNDGVLRRKDILKETLYRLKYPHATFTRVRYDQVDHLGCRSVGREVADFITFSKYASPSHTVSINEEWNASKGFLARRVLRELNDALDWKKESRRHRMYDFAHADSEEDNS
ncbi:hypothetical protein B484DRAFT_445750 [Ochromonadaceae sp. CCMP2298]|nr:hypothetical protein B484DRAFT_445750 [Ochromonadaceae sp. CCMP2298]